MTDNFTPLTEFEKSMAQPLLDAFPNQLCLVRSQLAGQDVAVVCDSEIVFSQDGGRTAVSEVILHPVFVVVTDAVFDQLTPLPDGKVT